MTTFRIMTLNIFYGGTTMNLSTGKKSESLYSRPETLDRVAEIIQMANVDAVGLQETDGNTITLAKKLGWFYSVRFNIISRFKLWESHLPYVYVEIEHNKIISIANIHALSEPYGPHLIQKGDTLEGVIEIENSFRLPLISRMITQLVVAQNENTIPLFITGDFNSPSSLDWTIESCRERDLPYPIQWPLSDSFLSMGFKDSYRVIHPCPIQKPGFTWFSDSAEAERHDIDDRIDWILYRGNIRAIHAWTIGENDNCDIIYTSWPSDHCGVISEFLVYPVYFPSRGLFVSKDIENIEIRSSGDIEILKDNQFFKYILSFSMDEKHSVLLKKGKYILRNLIFSIEYSIGFFPTIQVIRADSSAIFVEISGSSGMQMDWIRICRKGSERISVYVYTNAIYDGLISIKPPFYNEYNIPEWPLSSGEYDCCLLEDGGYRVLATTQFVI